MVSMTKCKCGQNILWMKTASGNKMPVNYDAKIVGEKKFDHQKMVSHFATCPFSKKFRIDRRMLDD